MSRLVLVYAAGLLLTGCGSTSIAEPDDQTSIQARLAHYEQLWLAMRPISYRMVLHRMCECTAGMEGPVRLYVSRRQGAITSSNVETTYWMEQAATGHLVQVEDQPLFLNVQELFALARRMADTGATIEIDVQEELGYPNFLLIDPDPATANDEIAYVVGELVVL
jgi:hypothetical protein